MKILITGTNGYIGKSLYNALKDKYDVTAITRQDFDLTISKAMFEFFKDKYFDIILHCAISGGSRLKEDTWLITDTNLTMYYNLLQCRNYYGKLISFGSGAEIHSPESPYGISKKIINKSIKNIDRFYNLRIYGVFDENELDTRFIKANIKKYINKEAMQIHETKFMDFFYMQDLIKVVEYYINEENPPKEFDCVYNGTLYTLFGLANIINKLDNYEVNIISKDKVVDDYVSKHRSKLPIEFIGLEQGIKEVYNKLK